MKHRKWILTAVILSGGIGLGVQSVSAQERPMGKQPDQTIPERVRYRRGSQKTITFQALTEVNGLRRQGDIHACQHQRRFGWQAECSR